MNTAILKSQGKIELVEMPLPEPGEGEIVIKIKTALTCGTDLKAFRRGHPQIPFPSVFGHEFSGDVLSVGANVNSFKIGDAVMGVHSAPCGECYFCKKGEANLCESVMSTKVLGAFAQYLKIPAHIVKQNIFIKPDSVPYQKAALLEPLSSVVHGFNKVSFKKGSSVLVIGTGAIGIMHLIIAKRLGAQHVTAIGKRSYRLGIAKKFCDTVFDANDTGLKEQIIKTAGGWGYDYVFECTGHPHVWEQSLRYVRKGGSVVLFGGCPMGTTVSFDTARIHYDELSIFGVFHFSPDDVKTAYELIKHDNSALDGLITHEFNLDNINQAFNLLQTGECLKIAITNDY